MKRLELVSEAVLLAGGRGTRFWPRSRTRTPKQLLNIVGKKTMLRETADRLAPIFPSRHLWVVTNSEQAAGARRELRGVPAAHILAEPMGRNTAAAVGLAAIHLAHKHGDALMAVLHSDSFVADADRYRALLRAALDLAQAPGTLVVLGIPPAYPETGYGYIERGPELDERPRGETAYAVARFTEKPAAAVARQYVDSGRFYWNAGMFVWRVSTLLDCLEKFLPETHAHLQTLAKTIGTKKYPAALKKIYPRLENISIDHAVMERATRSEGVARVCVLPAQVGWSDIGSWAALYELLAGKPGANVSAGPSFVLEAAGNYFWAPGKFVAAIGVNNLVVVETPDAILICPRDRSQDVGKIVKWLEERKQNKLL
ncbi:MAG TPA: sugar phosphate nucleotidyltransferase [Verrucomicrobiae bacterium]|nr:sugar phosphate nucleotidyltransferase [Verrucomicrobiae bacterium]